MVAPKILSNGVKNIADITAKNIPITTDKITAFTTEVLYKYTIKSGDNGELKPDGFVNAFESEFGINLKNLWDDFDLDSVSDNN